MLSPKRTDLPLQGVIGILTAGNGQEENELKRLAQKGLNGVEVRADLLLAENRPDGRPAWTREALIGRLRVFAEENTPVVFTVRVAGQGGAFEGPESERIKLYRESLRFGATVLDIEWGTEAARVLQADGAPCVISYHDFEGMPSSAELDRLTRELSSRRPLAIKVVPMASVLADSARMLEWVSAAPPQGPRRIGFAMGDRGPASRILSISRGAPLTYASLGRPVAPGQLPAGDLLELYRVQELGPQTRIFGVVGSNALSSFSPYLHNPALQRQGINGVYLPFQVAGFEEVVGCIDSLKMEGLSITIPFKQDAHDFADVVDGRSRACGAANTLVISAKNSGRHVAAYNTDFDGVLVPLRRRVKSLRGLDVAVIGNGGAARGAIYALKEAGATPTLYYRNAVRGAPVAEELGVPGRDLRTIADGRHRAFINATPLGSRVADASPVPATVFKETRGEERKIAFDMVYEPSLTRFLRDAKEAGALEIFGREMLVAQGVTQFKLFTGHEATLEEFDESFRRRQGDGG